MELYKKSNIIFDPKETNEGDEDQRKDGPKLLLND